MDTAGLPDRGEGVKSPRSGPLSGRRPPRQRRGPELQAQATEPAPGRKRGKSTDVSREPRCLIQRAACEAHSGSEEQLNSHYGPPAHHTGHTAPTPSGDIKLSYYLANRCVSSSPSGTFKKSESTAKLKREKSDDIEIQFPGYLQKLDLTARDTQAPQGATALSRLGSVAPPGPPALSTCRHWTQIHHDQQAAPQSRREAAPGRALSPAALTAPGSQPALSTSLPHQTWTPRRKD